MAEDSRMEEWSLDVINDYCKASFGDGDWAPFLCEMAPGKGRIMIAQKAVTQGELLFCEKPLHIVAEEPDNEAFVLVKSLCEEDPDKFDYEPLWYWTALCSLTAEQLKDGPQVGELKPVSAEQQRQLLCLYHASVNDSSEAVDKILEKLGLNVQAVIVEELLQAWILNCFEHAEDPLAYSAYFASSFISHSCGANAIWTEGDEGLHVLRARQDIKKGDEVSISYLNEQELLFSAEARKKSLQETKQFQCTCERCAAPVVDEEDDSEHPFPDMCRGFTCRLCGECGIFYRLDLCKPEKEKGGKGYGKAKSKGKGVPVGLAGVTCTKCEAFVDPKESNRLLEAEEKLEKKLDDLDKQLTDKSIGKVMTESKATALLQLVGNVEESPVGPQHWHCHRLWESMEKWYAQQNRRAEHREMLQLRIDFQRKAYPGLSGALAWTLEEQGDTILKHVGFGAKILPSDIEIESSLAAQVLPIFDESMKILLLMFGDKHEYYTVVEKKRTNAVRYFEKKKAAESQQ